MSREKAINDFTYDREAHTRKSQKEKKLTLSKAEQNRLNRLEEEDLRERKRTDSDKMFYLKMRAKRHPISFDYSDIPTENLVEWMETEPQNISLVDNINRELYSRKEQDDTPRKG